MKEIEKRIAEFSKEKEMECKMKAIKRAEEIVDSVIHKEISIPSIDTVAVPVRPRRPDNEKSINLCRDKTQLY